ncbi:hypothetical protein BGZ98_005148 [Dissophora globulifera]|nr:hypothetical protein BGZ98_005148 [Dissophora globulifera]
MAKNDQKLFLRSESSSSMLSIKNDSFDDCSDPCLSPSSIVGQDAFQGEEMRDRFLPDLKHDIAFLFPEYGNFEAIPPSSVNSSWPGFTISAESSNLHNFAQASLMLQQQQLETNALYYFPPQEFSYWTQPDINLPIPSCQSDFSSSSVAASDDVPHSPREESHKPYRSKMDYKALNKAKCTKARKGSPYKSEFECDKCDKTFNRQFNLKSHQRTHSNEKPNKCHYCPKAFLRKYDCERHVRKHEDNKHYQCEQCDEGFTRWEGLNRHKKTHQVQHSK